jgi:hypothetical protein
VVFASSDAAGKTLSLGDEHLAAVVSAHNRLVPPERRVALPAAGVADDGVVAQD